MTTKACCFALTLLLIVAISGIVSAKIDVSDGIIARSDSDCGNNFDNGKPCDNSDGDQWYEDKWQDTMMAAWTGSNNDDKNSDGNNCDDFKLPNFMWDGFKWLDFILDEFKFDGNK